MASNEAARAAVRARLAGLVCLAVVTAGCAARGVTLPTGAGQPLTDYAAVHAEAARSCAGVKTLSAELGLSGHAGDQKVRGRALAGFEVPDAMRLEGLAPFGPPAFILASRGGRATLLLPRDERVVRDARPDEILGALTGVALAPADLQAILSGCVVPSPTPIGGAQYGSKWRSVDLQGGATIYLQEQNGRWQVRAARRAGWQVEYPAWQGAFPRRVRLVSADAPDVDVRADISQLETNVDLPPTAFEVDVPREATPIGLDELTGARASGPRGQRPKVKGRRLQ